LNILKYLAINGPVIIQKLLFIFVLTVLSSPDFAQTHRIDSLKGQVNKLEEPKQKWEPLFALLGEKNSMASDSLYRYTMMAAQISDVLHDDSKKAWVRYNLTSRLMTKGMTDSALIETNKQLNELKSNTGEKRLYRKLLLTKGNLLIRSNKSKEALDMLYPFLNEMEKEKDEYIQAYVMNLIGTSYQILGQYQEAQQWFYKALQVPAVTTTAECYEIYCSLILNIGITYQSLITDAGSVKMIDSANYYLTKAIDLARKHEYLSTLTYALNVKGSVLVGINRIKEAEPLYTEGLAIRKQIGDPYYVINDLIGLARFYITALQPAKAISTSKEGIALADSFKVYGDIQTLYATLADSYKAAGDNINYAATLKQLVDIKDSVYKDNSAEALTEMQTKYEVQKKENTIIQQNYDLSRKNYLIYGALGLLIATLLIGYGIFQNRKKNQRLKMQELVIKQKQKTTQAVMEAEEVERKRIAGDLHDSVAQKIVVAKLNLEAFGNDLSGISSDQKKIYDNINALLEESAAEVRDLSHSMMPHSFAHSGLTDTVKDFLDKVTVKDLNIRFSAEGDFKKIKENTGLMIYRIIQECVQNALKHAKASQLDVAMIAENQEIDVTIEDNGLGFDTKAEKITNSSGMKNIRSRIEYLNGKLDIDSKPGKGTVVAFYIPFDQS